MSWRMIYKTIGTSSENNSRSTYSRVRLRSSTVARLASNPFDQPGKVFSSLKFQRGLKAQDSSTPVLQHPSPLGVDGLTAVDDQRMTGYERSFIGD
jgi:hypothetical protein